MISFELWFLYFSALPKLEKKIARGRQFFLRLRTLFAINSNNEFERIEKMLKNFLKIDLEDILKSNFEPLEERLDRDWNIPITQYLQRLRPFNFPYLVNLSIGFDETSKIFLIVARSFPRIEMFAGDFKDSEIWNLIKEHIEKFSVNDRRIKVLDLPNCRELYIEDSAIEEIRAPKLIDFSYDMDSSVPIPRGLKESLSSPLLKNLSLMENYSDEVLKTVLKNKNIESLSFQDYSVSPMIDFSPMLSLKKIKLIVRGNLEDNQKFPAKFPPTLEKLTLIFRRTSGKKKRIWLPAVKHLKVHNLFYQLYIAPDSFFSDIKILELSGTNNSVNIEQSLNPQIVLDDKYVKRNFFSFSSSEVFQNRNNTDIRKIKKYSEAKFKDVSLPNLLSIGIDVFLQGVLYSDSLLSMYYQIEEHANNNWDNILDISDKPSVRKLKLSRPEFLDDHELDIEKLAGFIRACPRLEEIVLEKNFDFKFRILEKSIRFLVNQWNPNIQVYKE